MRKLLWVITTFAFLLSLTACASNPEQELAATRQALDAAKAAEADIYAPAEYSAASEVLGSAEAEIAAQDQKFALTRSYSKAKELLNNAKSQADAAVSAAKTNKEKTRAEAETAQTEAQQAVEAAKTALSKAPKGKGTKADLKALKGDLSAAQTAFSEAQQAYNSGKYKDALSGFKSVKEKADSVSNQIQEAAQKS